MHLKYSIDDAQIADMNLTITVTMPVARWRELMRAKTIEAHYSVLGRLQTTISSALGDLARATEKSYEYK